MTPAELSRLLAEPERLKVYAAVVLGAATPSEAASATGLPAREVVRALTRLEQAGLIRSHDGRLDADTDVFKAAVRRTAAATAPAEPLDPDRTRAAVLANFVRDGRLLQIPAGRARRRVVLEHIVTCFEPGVKYPERAVDAMLRAWHSDYAALRRHLIDADLMTREAGVYWRTGGWVDTAP